MSNTVNIPSLSTIRPTTSAFHVLATGQVMRPSLKAGGLMGCNRELSQYRLFYAVA